MIALRDVVLGLWIAAVTFAAFGALPARVLGRPAHRRSWWAVCLAGATWSMLATAALVPVLAVFHLFNWATAVVVPFAWPVALWLYRYRGAPSGAFRALCRRLTLRVLTYRPAWRVRVAVPGDGVSAGICAAALLYFLAARELRFGSPDDYDTLAGTHGLLAGGQWIVDPFASIAAVISRLAAVDPMEAVRFLAPLTWPGAVIAHALHASSLTAAFAWSAVLTALALAALSLRAVRPRERWHAVAAGAVAAIAFSVPSARAADGAGYVEYDAAPRQALAIARGSAGREWLIVAPMEQRAELTDPRRFVPLNEFVARFADRAGDGRFRFDVGGRDLFVFVEKRPLPIHPGTALTRARYARSPDPFWLPNARARVERRALQLCEAYRRTHAGVTVHYEDANLRIYHIRH